MSSPYDPQVPPPPGEVPPPLVIPVRYQAPPMAPPPAPAPRGSVLGSLFRVFLVFGLALSMGLNIVLLVAALGGGFGDGGSLSVRERSVSGESTAHNKIAVVKLDGVIMEGATAFTEKEIDQAAQDEHVKAVVLRINSPGGSITASDDLHRRIEELAQGKRPKQKGGKKHVIVSMGALAASGGYYAAMPAEWLVAEPTTITGSIGVYAAFPNIAGLAEKYGFGMNVIKAGEVKDSGSMFHKMSPEEHQLWQDMVDNAFARFLKIVEDGRPALKGKLREVVIRRTIPAEGDKETGWQSMFGKEPKTKTVEYVRRRADGGIWTAQDALKFGLIDEIGYQEAAVTKAASAAGLGSDYRVITYERPATLANLLLGSQDDPSGKVDAKKLSEAAMPRLWYLAPQSEMSGLLTAIGSK